MIKPEIPVNQEARTGLSMGEHTAITAKEWGITREDQDELTFKSHQNLAAAWESGWQDDLVTPYIGVDIDGNMRADTTMEKLAKLKPVFGGKDGTMTAANSTPLSRWRQRRAALNRRVGDLSVASRRAPVSLTPRPQLLTTSSSRRACCSRRFTPCRVCLSATSLTLQDFDFYEIHEAFAAQALRDAEGLGRPDVLQEPPRPRQAARIDRSLQS